MKVFEISKAALRVLSQQLQAKGDGFNIKQLRQLDKVVTVFDVQIGEYNKKLDDLIDGAKLELVAEPGQATIINEKLNQDLDAITDSEGPEMVTIELEDADYEFTKQIWDNMSGYRGNLDVRHLVIEADDALQGAKDPSKEGEDKK